MDACKTLADYARYTQRVRDYAEEMPLNQAVERAVTECIREGILEEFLRENRSWCMCASTNMMRKNISGRKRRKAGMRDFRKDGNLS